ncbi:hypothetical protein BDN72DRAFT_926024 [Pluteus cervinus]|uniref:Uncharacterized protein n=1 Tax=Pluteus cervinus TaxID=181527 RepID=A0ACD3AEY2_9AGAR|nr:hypothetical protein BDN72DRAFT_926024 [Pluteus cervinus]
MRAVNPRYDPHFEERSKIEQEILHLEYQLHQLRVKRNSLIPISNLPADVLVDIFLLAATELDDEDVYPKRVVDISWVCSLWREVTLDHPILWTQISCSLSPPWKRMFIERSKPAGISIAVQGADIMPELMEVLISELPRIRHLDWSNGNAQMSAMITTVSPRSGD